MRAQFKPNHDMGNTVFGAVGYELGLRPDDLLGRMQRAVRVQKDRLALTTGRSYWDWTSRPCDHCYGSGVLDVGEGNQECPNCDGWGRL